MNVCQLYHLSRDLYLWTSSINRCAGIKNLWTVLFRCSLTSTTSPKSWCRDRIYELFPNAAPNSNQKSKILTQGKRESMSCFLLRCQPSTFLQQSEVFQAREGHLRDQVAWTSIAFPSPSSWPCSAPRHCPAVWQHPQDARSYPSQEECLPGHT